LINKTVALPPELDGIEAGQGVGNVKEVITIDDEMHEIDIVDRVTCLVSGNHGVTCVALYQLGHESRATI
jgi:hypothetical protein